MKGKHEVSGYSHTFIYFNLYICINACTHTERDTRVVFSCFMGTLRRHILYTVQTLYSIP